MASEPTIDDGETREQGAEPLGSAPLLGGLDGLLVDEGCEDLFQGDMPASCPRERRAADIRFAALAGAIVLVAVVGGILPGHQKRSARIARYTEILRESATVRQDLAELARIERRLEARDPYLIERLARDRMHLMGPGEQRLPEDAPEDSARPESRAPAPGREPR